MTAKELTKALEDLFIEKNLLMNVLHTNQS
jgi:hypothetical protein